MATAFICDRCNRTFPNKPYARVFLERRESTRSDGKSIVRADDLCQPCTEEIAVVIRTMPAPSTE